MSDWRDCFNFFSVAIGPSTIKHDPIPKMPALMFDLDQTPDAINAADLPCMVYHFDERLKAGNEAPSEYVPGKAETSIKFEHWCLVLPPGRGMGLMQAQPEVIRLLDAYETAIAVVPDLNGRLSKAMVVSNKRLGKLRWGLVSYHGFAVELTWTRRF